MGLRKWWTGLDMEGCGVYLSYGRIHVIFVNKMRKTTINISQDSQCCGRGVSRKLSAKLNHPQIVCNCRTRQAMYVWRNIEARSRKPLLPWKSDKYHIFRCVCVRGCGCRGAGVCLRACSITNPACNAHAPYCHLGPLWLHFIFRHYLSNSTIFGKRCRT